MTFGITYMTYVIYITEKNNADHRCDFNYTQRGKTTNAKKGPRPKVYNMITISAFPIGGRVSKFWSADLLLVVVVVCFHDLRFCLSSQLKAASCARCSSEMPPSKQVNGHSFTTCLIVWGSPHSQSGEAI